MKTNKFFYTLLALVITSVSVKAQSTSAQPSDSLQTIQLKVKGITCSGDLKMISENAGKADGIKKCDAVGKMSATSTFEIVFNPSKISNVDIVKIIEDTPSCDHPKEKPYKVKNSDNKP